ncbi:hypothetical protein SAMN02745166_01491 [Prosthecobacter debontii]|uniref:Fibronectin type-III domain-containing protein n=1 Tax=Prosthecobacter debontii TaxID=48467 RepID=A0A1T4XGU5_9BACT|nr:fibronectin type III domain-containing protein [Prosthecobacter debontii]SKA88822.1 hypothetical protein SAMN02745166_01491 [Prosthecobacter debontii]
MLLSPSIPKLPISRKWAVAVAPGILTPPTVQPVIQSVTGNELSKELFVTWSASNKAGSPGFIYVIETSDDAGDTWDYFGETTGLSSEMSLGSFSDGEYLIRVVPANDAGQGPGSEPEAVTLPVPMAAPGVSIESEYLSYVALITWTSVIGATAYDIEAQSDGGGWSSLASGLTVNYYEYDAGLSGGFYEFRVRGTNGFGEGPWSDPAGVTLPGESESGEGDTYRRPDGVSRYLRPDGTSTYLRFAA